MPLTRRQALALVSAGPSSEAVQKPKKIKKLKKREIVHNNWLSMILLMPLYAYMVMRQKLQDEEVCEESETLMSRQTRLSMEAMCDDTSEHLRLHLDDTSEPKLGPWIDLRKFILKTEYTEVRVFANTKELLLWQRDQATSFKVSHSNNVKCSLVDCDDDRHKMRIQYMHCECCHKCELKLRVKSCLSYDNISVSRGYAGHCCCQKAKSTKRGPILGFIKNLLISMMDNDPDLTPKRAHTRLTTKRKENNSYPNKCLPSLKQAS